MPNTDRPFWLAMWQAAAHSCAYRRHAREWRAAGSVDYAAQLEQAAEAFDAEWDARMRAVHDRGRA